MYSNCRQRLSFIYVHLRRVRIFSPSLVSRIYLYFQMLHTATRYSVLFLLYSGRFLLCTGSLLLGEDCHELGAPDELLKRASGHFYAQQKHVGASV